MQYDWLWKSDKDPEYKKFALESPSLDDYEAQLRKFGFIQKEIDSVSSIHIIGALSLNTKHLKLHLGRECDNWKFTVRWHFCIISIKFDPSFTHMACMSLSVLQKPSFSSQTRIRAYHRIHKNDLGSSW
jgi:hypothetical protein